MISNFVKAFNKRGLQPTLAASQANFYNAPTRFFSKNEEVEADAEPEVEAEAEAAEPFVEVVEHKPEPVKMTQPAAPTAGPAFDKPLDKSLFNAFSVGDIAKIESTPDHKPPSEEDTIAGRYSGVLFTTASMKGDLYNVYEDMKYLQEILKYSDMFKLFTENAGVDSIAINKLNNALKETAPFSETTLRFMVVLAENKRLNRIGDISEKYAKLYQEFNKEEKITIISAADLSADQKSQVVAALESNP